MTFLSLQQLVIGRSFATLPSVAQAVDVATLGNLPGYLKAIASFLLVTAFGGVILIRSEPFLRRSVDALQDRPYSAVPYGLMAYVVALPVGLFGLSQLGRVAFAGPLVVQLLALVLLGAIAALTAFGFLVVGTLVTQVQGQRRPGYGLVLGGVLSAVGWLALPTVGGFVASVLVAAFGLGGAVRRWFHAERTVETERAG